MPVRRFLRNYSFTDDKGNERLIIQGWEGDVSDSVAKAADEAGVTDQSKPPEQAQVKPGPDISEVGLGKPAAPPVQENPVIQPKVVVEQPRRR